jgi:outer membrane protein assembly factor BamB
MAWALRLTATGRVVWQVPVRGYAHPTRLIDREPMAPVSPLVAGPVAVVADGDAVTGLRLAEGRVLWRWAGPSWVDGLWRWRGLVAVLTGGQSPHPWLTGLDAATGAVAWTRHLPADLYSPPAATADGGLAVAGGGPPASGAGVLEVVSLGDGNIRWVRRMGLFGPLAAAGRLVLATPDGRRLAGYDDRAGVTRWVLGHLASDSLVTARTGRAVVTWTFQPAGLSTLLTAINEATGRVRWQFSPQPGVSNGGPLVALDTRSGPAVLATGYLGYRPGRLWLLSGRTGHLRWSVPASLLPFSAPLPAGADVVTLETPEAAITPIPSAIRLVSRDAATGAIKWARRLPGGAIGPAVQAGPDIVVRPNRSVTDSEPSKVLLSYRAATGQPAWHITLPAPAEMPPAPAATGLLVQAGDDTTLCSTPP